ncbi:hypothetical protein PJ985_14030 [Streptomyces sp. ACA25]|uniref:hypothetical protein n=1 Tax=Streptomyces sp. ACA25 TaxID=3022596 RepID=UPI002307F295|nr:hypothetical protein [Streptomyces sp. ACA25]MDB1088687.1 hypothetical protein [Streptomyces sp. ACA25]
MLYYRGRKPHVVLPEGQEGIWLRRLLRWPYSALEIQLGSHTLSFSMRLPAADSVSFFPARIKVTWRVRDPLLVAGQQVSDVAALLASQWEEQLKEVSRRFSIAESDYVDAAARQALREADLGARYGIELEVYVDIIPDELTIGHAKQRIEAQHSQALERLHQQLRLMENANEREIVKEWAEHFQGALGQGDTAVMAELMARNRNDIPAIRNMLADEQRTARQDGMELMTRLIDGGLLERWELGDQAKVVVDFLQQGTQRAIGSATGDVERQRTGEVERPEPVRPLFWESTDGEDDGAPSGSG